MNGEITLYTHLKNDSNVTALLTGSGTKKRIAIGVREPTTWKPSDSTISIYNAVGMDNRDKRMIVDLTVNCRASTENKAKELASAVVTSLYRAEISGGGGRYYTSTGFVIVPQDETDSFNLPVTVTIKAGEVKP